MPDYRGSRAAHIGPQIYSPLPAVYTCLAHVLSRALVRALIARARHGVDGGWRWCGLCCWRGRWYPSPPGSDSTFRPPLR
jgi:hypothetical protein